MPWNSEAQDCNIQSLQWTCAYPTFTACAPGPYTKYTVFFKLYHMIDNKLCESLTRIHTTDTGACQRCTRVGSAWQLFLQISVSLTHPSYYSSDSGPSLDKDKIYSDSPVAYLRFPNPELLECHQVLHITQCVFLPTSILQLLLKLYLKSNWYIIQNFK